VGLDAQRASEILATDEFASDVRKQEQFYLEQGIHSVPAVVINDRHPAGNRGSMSRPCASWLRADNHFNGAAAVATAAAT
jgi:hypothetical protein